MSARLRSLPVAAWRRFRAARRRSQAVIVVLVLAVLALAGAAGASGGGTHITESEQRITVADGPHGDQRVRLDTTFYRPAGSQRLPAVILAHGFGGSKRDLREQAGRLAEDGYAVLTFSARGFGESTGRIELDSPDYEVKDVQGLIDWLARRDDIVLDHRGDPRVGITGGSYGGAIALLAAAYDRRIDAIVPTSTWNDLSAVFFRQSADARDRGVFARGWAGLFFGTQSRPGQPCGRLAPDVCAAYQDAAENARPSARTIALLKHSSPAGVLDRIHAPTLLIQGETDSLFGLDQADANAAGITAPVHVAWYAGGHDAGSALSETDRLRDLTRNWFDHWLRHSGSLNSDGFTVSSAAMDASTNLPAITVLGAHRYTGLHSDPDRISLQGGPQPISNPPGGEPKAISSIPGAGLLSSRLVTEIPGQSAQFISAPLRRKLRIVGAGTVRLRVSSSERAATFFVKLYDIGPDGDRELPGGAVAPVQLEKLDRARTVTVQLPAIAHDFPADHQLAVVVSATDQAYSGPRDERRYQVKLTGPLIAPTLRAHLVDGPSATWPWVAAAAGILLAGILALVIGGRRRRRASTAGSGPPVVVDHLRKSYGDQVTAVAGLSFTVEPGQILGLLGPNGAGKTTTLRMLLGLITPSGGQIRLFGSRVGPGAPVLRRVGALVEGPGLLPHLSGMDNLRLFWRATGRPEPEAEFDEVLRIARLGPAVERRVRTYSHGMRQRLAIAQAMLGLPDLLVLDEPTNGLDPPQIRDLRGVLQDYVAGGRTVVVSSHLLGEVEQTCTHVVVMDRGRVAAAGTVAQIIGTGDTLVVATDDLDRSVAVLERLPGVREVSHDGVEITVTLDGAGPGQLTAALVAAGREVRKIAPRRRLEDAFVTLVGEGTV